MANLRVLLVDDDVPTLRYLISYVHREPDLDLVGSCTDGLAALEFVRTHPVDVVVSDITMPQLDGRELLRRLQQLDPAPVFVAMTLFDTDETMLNLLSNGAAAYLVKSAEPTEICHIIRTAAHGGTVISPQAMSRAISYLATPHTDLLDTLTPAQRLITELVCEGLSNRDIARRSQLSLSTIKKHLNSTFTALGVESRTGLVSVVMRAKFLRDDLG